MKNDFDRAPGWPSAGPGRQRGDLRRFADDTGLTRQKIQRMGGVEKLSQLKVNRPDIWELILKGVL